MQLAFREILGLVAQLASQVLRALPALRVLLALQALAALPGLPAQQVLLAQPEGKVQ